MTKKQADLRETRRLRAIAIGLISRLEKFEPETARELLDMLGPEPNSEK